MSNQEGPTHAKHGESKQEILAVAQHAARQAATVLKRYAATPEVSFKASQTQNLVTQADVDAEQAILKEIRQHYPDHDLLCEESLPTAGTTAASLWIIDPLDGTTNYAHGIPQFCTSIAYAESGTVQVGVVYDPMRDEMFHAVRGEGAFLNDVQIHCAERQELSEAVVATGFYYDRGDLMRRTLRSIERLFEHNVRGIRRFGGAALDLSWVACGRIDAFFEYQLSPWDYAAGSLIIEEAGGKCADRTGKALEIDSRSTIVASEPVFAAICDVVRWE